MYSEFNAFFTSQQYAPIAWSYRYEHRVHATYIVYTTKLAAPLAYAAPIT